MNKGQGLTVGAVLAATLFFRPGGTTEPHGAGSAGDVGSEAAIAAKSAAREGVQEEGPWIASCKYWAPARSTVNDPPRKVPRVHGTFPAKDGHVDLYMNLEETASESGCSTDGAERWGVPGGDRPFDVQTIIATVPDPVHSHLALTFDQMLDALLQAANDNSYVSSTFWLPWKSHTGALRGEAYGGGTEYGHDAGREREPGLIILKHVPGNGTDFSPIQSYYKVIYLFLVAETPAQGVDGFQLSKAFAYQKELNGAFGDAPDATCPSKKVSMGQDCKVAIIGPLYTGSAASLRAGIEAAGEQYHLPEFIVRGMTSTGVAPSQLNNSPVQEDSFHSADDPVKITYFSYDSNVVYEEDKFLKLLIASGYSPSRVAELEEDNTAFGNSAAVDRLDIPLEHSTASHDAKDIKNDILRIRFPREISVLRNAQLDSDSSGANSGAAPSPYLRLSAKDSGAQDTVPQFSKENTPLSQEAQLMEIGRQMQRKRIQFILTVASNNLDQIFLARFLHRFCPDARLVFVQDDLMMAREVDDIPFVGSVTVSPHPFTEVTRRAFPNGQAIAYYDAASKTFWDQQTRLDFVLDNDYKSPFRQSEKLQPPLWATAIGSDGYYPLGVISPCASDNPKILPSFGEQLRANSQDCANHAKKQGKFEVKLSGPYPASLMWAALCIVVSLLCLVHAGIVWKADYWSPLSHHVAIAANDEPAVRSVFVQIAGAMLFLMAYVVAIPMLALKWIATISLINSNAAFGCLLCGVLALGVSTKRTWGYTFSKKKRHVVEKHLDVKRKDLRVVWLMYGLTGLTLAVVCGIWGYLCFDNSPLQAPSYLGFSFSYRCTHPASGVSPLIAILALLVSWHLWALLQTMRLRFSRHGRPLLVGRLTEDDSHRYEEENRYYVSYEELGHNRPDGKRCLYENITEAFLTTRLFPNLSNKKRGLLNVFSLLAYTVVPALFSLYCFFNGVDHFLWGHSSHFLASPFEMLIGFLFYPLLAMALSGWVRMLLVWTSLRRGLLERLENMPIRVAFSRMKGIGWMTLLRQGTIHGQWRDMARSIESIRQILNREDLRDKISGADYERLKAIQETVLSDIRPLRKDFAGAGEKGMGTYTYELMADLEEDFAKFGRVLLSALLIPYWRTERTGMVEGENLEELPLKARRSLMGGDESQLPMELHAGPASGEPELIVVAEEFIAIRYMTLIRAVLANMRYLMAFVLAFFVLSIVGWNSYPFQPQLVDWLFTGLLVILIAGVVWVFAQMHRNAILSRVTDTKANELGWDFYLRVVAFGAIPVLTWVAYQFPDVGSVIYRFLQPGVSVLK